MWVRRRCCGQLQASGGGIVEGVDCMLEAVAPDCLVLKWSVSMAVEVPSISEGSIKGPQQQVDQLVDPEVVSEVMLTNNYSCEKVLLYLSPLAGESTTEKWAPSKPSLFLS